MTNLTNDQFEWLKKDLQLSLNTTERWLDYNQGRVDFSTRKTKQIKRLENEIIPYQKKRIDIIKEILKEF